MMRWLNRDGGCEACLLLWASWVLKILLMHHQGVRSTTLCRKKPNNLSGLVVRTEQITDLAYNTDELSLKYLR